MSSQAVEPTDLVRPVVPDLAERERLDLSPRTGAKALRRFVRDRLRNPARVAGATIYSFSREGFDDEAIIEAARWELRDEVYVIPYEPPNIWAYIRELLPAEIRSSPRLVYWAGDSEYIAVKNYRDKISQPSIDRYREQFGEIVELERGERIDG